MRKAVLAAVCLSLLLGIYVGTFVLLIKDGHYYPAVIGLNHVKWYGWKYPELSTDPEWNRRYWSAFAPLISLDRRFWHPFLKELPDAQKLDAPQSGERSVTAMAPGQDSTNYIASGFWGTLVVTLVVAGWLGYKSTLAFRERLRQRPKRLRGNDAMFERAFATVVRAIGEDLSVPADNLVPADRLRETLGYVFDNLAGVDQLFDAYLVVSSAAGVDMHDLDGCETLGDLAKRLVALSQPK